jgi:hypothetical protein
VDLTRIAADGRKGKEILLLKGFVAAASGLIASAGFGIGLFLYLFLVASHARPTLQIWYFNLPHIPQLFLVMSAIGIVLSGWLLIPFAVFAERRYRGNLERMCTIVGSVFLVSTIGVASYILGVTLGFVGGLLGIRLPIT